ncbi:MAG TPA: HD domain-containing phosphohydrolase [Malonomonas sp.]
MSSLKIKILGISILITIVAVTVATWHSMRTQDLMFQHVARQSGRVIAQAMHNSIVTAMQTGRNDDVINILQKIETEQTISSPRIFDETGRILMSTNQLEIGQTINDFNLNTYRSNPTGFSQATRDGATYITTLPIENQTQCHACHGPEEDVLGVFTVELSLCILQQLKHDGEKANLASSLSLLAVLVVSLVIFILHYVDRPIRKLISAMTELEQGNFSDANASVQNSREMSLLAEKYNRMVERLKTLLESTVHFERELAVNREKLLHKDKIASMNLTLEERLNEIELLNINLEERIEEVEGANFKIADLASELEDRNTTLAQAVKRLSSLYEMGLVINSTMDLKSLFNLLLRKALDSLGADIGYILLYDKDNDNLSIGDACGIPPGNYDPEMEIPLSPGGASHWVIKNRAPLLIAKIDNKPEFSRMSRLGFTRDSVICAPLIVCEEVFGTITIANKPDGSPFYEPDLELLSTISAQASVAIQNARLYEDQQNTYLSTVQALVSAIEASDPYTRGHSERVTRYSLALAHKLNLDEAVLKDLEQAAILHDIGKIGIDVSLLHKVGDLSLNDIDKLQEHPLIGMRILSPIHFMAQVRKIIGQHHERYDGKGYPLGICGDELLIEARILAITDSFDAMTSDRPYRKALPVEVALSEIKNHRGTQFDPEIADIFIAQIRSVDTNRT